MAMLGGVVSGCDKQQLGGSVPNQAAEQQAQSSAPQPQPQEQGNGEESAEEEEEPQLLSGDVPVENLPKE